MIEYINREIQQIEDFFRENDDWGVYILHSESGMGKKTIINSYIEKYKITAIYLNNSFPSPFFELAEQLKLPCDEFHQVYMSLFKLINKSNVAIIFQNAENITQEVCDLFNKLLLSTKKLKIFLLLNKVSMKSNSLIYYNLLANLDDKFINRKLEHWTSDDLHNLVKEKYPQYTISQVYLDKITTLAFGNPSIFLVYLRYLFFDLNLQTADAWEKGFDESLLFPQLSSIVELRYQRLDPILKEVIKKSSVIGNDFNINTLTSSLNVRYAKEYLEKIENISELIHKKIDINTEYCFENIQTHISIYSYVEPHEAKEWSLTIANYFAELLFSNRHLLKATEMQEYCYKAYYYYKEAGAYKKAIIFSFELFPIYIGLGHYNTALAIMDEVNQYQYLFSETQKKLFYIFKMHCYEAEFRFADALKSFYEYESISFEDCDYLIKYKKSLYLYNSGHITEAYNILKELDESIAELDLKKLKYQIYGLNLLSSIQETMQISTYVEQYDRAVYLAKENHMINAYYYLLRKANFAHRGELGIPMLEASYKYFKGKKNLNQQAMAAHNIGTEYMYCLNQEMSSRYLNEAYDLFLKTGSDGLNYTLNSLSIYNIIFLEDYSTGLKLLEQAQQQKNEDFNLITYMNNRAVYLRKQNLLDECNECLKWIEKRNQKAENHFPAFDSVLNLQKAYFYKEKGELDCSLNYFVKYIQSGHNKIQGMRIAAIKNAKILSEMLNIPLPDSIIKYKNANSRCGTLFFENDWLFCNLQFWE